MIIGLTGTKASGKGEVAEILKKRDFVYSSLSDRVREEAINRGLINYVIKDLQNIGNELRANFGNGIWAKKTLEILKKELEEGKNLVIDGIRNLGEIEELKNHKDFILIAVDAPAKDRFNRIISRNRESDPKTWEGFLDMDQRDKGLREENTGQQVERCIETADYKIDNNGSLEELKEKADDILKKLNINKDAKRPSWDEYFMKMAALVAERSTCLRHHIGAVIVKDKRVLTTGYNGAVKGMKDCIELGCLKDEMGLASGMGYETCRSVHAEQNAIIQAGLHGININESVLYNTHTPCMICAKALVNAGIKEVISYHDFEGDRGAKDFLIKAGIKLRKIPRPSEKIGFKD